MREKYLGLDIDLNTTLAVGTVIFRPSHEALVRQMRKRGWSIDFKMGDPVINDLSIVTTSVTFEASIFKNGEPKDKAEWDAELAEIMQAQSSYLESSHNVQGGQ